MLKFNPWLGEQIDSILRVWVHNCFIQWNESRFQKIMEEAPFYENQSSRLVRSFSALTRGREYIVRLNPLYSCMKSFVRIPYPTLDAVKATELCKHMNDLAPKLNFKYLSSTFFCPVPPPYNVPKILHTYKPVSGRIYYFFPPKVRL